MTGRSEVAELHVITHARLLENPKDAVFLRGLDVEDEGIRQRIHAKISEDAALLIEQEAIGRRTGRQNLQVWRHKAIQERNAFGARECDFRAIAEIDHARARPGHARFRVDGPVSRRDGPARFVAEQRPVEIMVGLESQLLHVRDGPSVGTI